MSFVSANIHDKNVVLPSFCPFNELVLHRIESWIHPTRPSLVVGGHKVVELRSKIGILGILAVEPFEKMIVGLEPQGERAVCPFSGTLVVVLLEPGSQRVDGRNGGAGAVFKKKMSGSSGVICVRTKGTYG